jgi:arsenate reductase-like glutaredoxin family protein
MTCKKAQGFLEAVGGRVEQQTEASKSRLGPREALKLLEGMDRLVAMRGKKVNVFDLKKNPPDEATLLSHLIGPTGKLRAPTARVGKTLLVGFNEEIYRAVLGLASST